MYEGTTTLQEIADFVNSGHGFVLILIDIDKVKTSRTKMNSYQGHYQLIYVVDFQKNDLVMVLDVSEDVGKEFKFKVSEFEVARTAEYTD